MAKVRAPPKPAPPISTAPDLWTTFVVRAGLQTKIRKDGGLGYDTALETRIRKSLDLPSGIMRAAIRRRGVTLESLLETLLTALQPWSLMMADILAMLTAANAGRTGETIALSVDFDKFSPAFRESLSSFQVQSSRIDRVVTSPGGRRWGELDLWGLFPVDHTFDGDLRSGRWTSPEFQTWLAAHHEGERIPPPPLPPTGISAFDSAVRSLEDAVRSVIRAAARAGSTPSLRYDAMRANPDKDFGDGWTGDRLHGVDSNLAGASLLTRFASYPRQASWTREQAEALAEELRTKLAAAPLSVPTAQRVSDLFDMLDLPVWRRRHELYSVWIATVIAGACRFPWTWCAVDGVLSFSFAGSRIARINLDRHEAILWAELRRKVDLTGISTKRRGHVQPDYTLVFGDDRKSALAGLVVECKQYRKPSRCNFDDALRDYSFSHNLSPVLLLNYGPVGPTIAEELAEARGAPVKAFGDVFPGSSALPGASSFLHETFELMDALAEIGGAPRKLPGDTALEITLSWGAGGDLDLHVVHAAQGISNHVSYENPGRLDEPPFIQLSGDARAGPAQEQIRIAAQTEGVCDVYVHRFSGDWPQDGTERVTIGRGESTASFRRPIGAVVWWHVCTIDLKSSEILTRNGAIGHE